MVGSTGPSSMRQPSLPWARFFGSSGYSAPAEQKQIGICCYRSPHGLAETRLRLERFLLRQQPGGESLPFADSLDFDRRGFDDVLNSRYPRRELRISPGLERLSLSSALTEEVRTGERTRENTDPRDDSDERDDYAEVTWTHLTI